MDTFEINAFTATLGKTVRKNSLHIVGNGDWIIPIYQRPYSWGENEVNKFLRDLRDNFYSEDSVPSPMFIGTMQVSAKENNAREVIDGQQRLTTFLLLFHVLNQFNPDVKTHQLTNWIKTRVNRGEAQNSLNNAINNTLDKEVKDLEVNRYSQNLALIHNYIKDNIDLDDVKGFQNFILNQVYFVCIETKANLSKTLQIFESINATGMDLNTADLFKVRFYEYLRIKENASESVFESISDLYATIDKANKSQNDVVTSIADILAQYQVILISKYDLSNALYFMNTETFYDKLFDRLLNNVTNEGFGEKINKVKLSISDLESLINSRIEWHSTTGKTLEEDMAYYFIVWSRYNRYWRAILAFEFAYKENITPQLMSDFKIKLSKLLIIYSVKFGKAVNECHNFIRTILKSMFSETNPQRIIDLIDAEIRRHSSTDLDKGHFEIKMNESIASIPKSKYLLCRLGAMLSEDYLTSNERSIKDLREILCFNDIDIEHIQSYNHEDLSLRESIWEEWKDEINSLGNLVVLERSINRNIKNSLYNIKKDSYVKSQFSIIKELNPTSGDWILEDAQRRRETESKRIMKYIFE
ncbi:DUF262 domain-containing protein [Nonlabens sp. Asnod3-A02]|uniref:DUF262 domain-containing protein n=1 Tax=Nonlabens sp. Asnod3-A02 TaxID=3160579 RepID=UPI003870998A